MAASPFVDPTMCPLCGHPNICTMEVARITGQVQAPCWCATRSFSAPLLAKIPEAARGKACICASCAARVSP